jgi:hypothetical protein
MPILSYLYSVTICTTRLGCTPCPYLTVRTVPYYGGRFRRRSHPIALYWTDGGRYGAGPSRPVNVLPLQPSDGYLRKNFQLDPHWLPPTFAVASKSSLLRPRLPLSSPPPPDVCFPALTLHLRCIHPQHGLPCSLKTVFTLLSEDLSSTPVFSLPQRPSSLSLS